MNLIQNQIITLITAKEIKTIISEKITIIMTLIISLKGIITKTQ
jgi:hypothetical protein